MGKMKEIAIQMMNEERGATDDIDWNYMAQPSEPEPIDIQPDGKKLYLVKSIKDNTEYKIWAYSYAQALELLPMIESF